MTISLVWSDCCTAALVNHLWQSTVVVAIAWMQATALKRNHARVRHWVWFAASVKFLLPFELLFAAGAWMRSWLPGAAVRPAIPSAMEHVTQPFAEKQYFGAAALVEAHQPNWPPRILLAIWVCGVMVIAMRFGRAWWKVHKTRRTARLLQVAADVPVLSSRALIEPGIFGILRPVLLLPEGILERLSAEQMRAIVVHEMGHARRRDNLTFAIHMITEALFWFNPVVWWIGIRLIDERERACDEEVVQMGGEVQAYAEGILNVCKFYVESPLECFAGATGADLKKRIVRIMTKHREIDLSRAKRLLLSTTAMLAVTVPVGFGLGQVSNEQDWEKAAGGKMAFEVASVRLNPGPIKPSNFRLSPDDAYTNTGGLLNADFPLETYIDFAYKIQPTREQSETMYAHMPKWVQTENYEIRARAGAQNPSKDQMRLMMQALLKERFGLVVHYDTQDTVVLEMSLVKPGKLGPKLRRHEEGPACSVTAPPGAGVVGTPAGGVVLKGPDVFPARCGGIEAEFKPNQMMLMGGRDTTMEMIAGYLSIGHLGRPVVNETGLSGKYDFTLNWAPEPGTFRTGPGPASQDAPASHQQGPTFLEAVADQLGLKLKPGKAPLKELVIDHVARPSEN